MVNYDKMSLTELKDVARKAKIRGFSTMKKADLAKLLSGGVRAAKAEQKKAKKGSKKGSKLKHDEAYCVAMKKKCKPTDVKYVKKVKGGRTTHLMMGYCGDHKVAKIVSETEYNKRK